MNKILQLSLLLILALSIYSCKQDQKNYIISSGDKQIFYSELDTFFLRKMDSLKMVGLDIAIIENASVTYHRTFGVTNAKINEKITENTLFEAASFSKPLFAYFVMKQVEKGIIDLDKPLCEYLPYPDIEYDERYKLITARIVLSHQSGFPNWRFNEPDNKLDIEFDPGTSFQYSGEGYQYLSKVLAHLNNVHESKLDSIFQQEVAIPLEADYLTYNWNDSIAKYKAFGHKKGNPTHNKPDKQDINGFGAAHSLHTNSINYSKFIIALLHREGLTPNNFDELLSEQVKVPENNIMRRVAGITEWSLGFAMQKSSNKLTYSHFGDNGHFTSYFNFYPETQSGIIIFSNSEVIMYTDFITELGEFLGENIKCDVSQMD